MAAGFPRDLTRRTFESHWEKVKSLVPTAYTNDVKLFAGTGRVYSIGFTTMQQARDFLNAVNPVIDQLPWESSRPEDTTPFPIRFRFERSIPEREMGRAFSVAWERVLKRLQESPHWNPKTHRLITERRKEALAIAVENDFWYLYTLRRDRDGKIVDLCADESSLAYWGIGKEEAEEIRVSIVAAASVERPAARS